MNKLLFMLFAALTLFAADFEWYKYKEGLQKAKELNRPIFIMISQKGCVTCEYMDDVAFENEELVDFVENNYIPIKLDIKEAKEVGLKAYGTPTFYFLRPDGTKIGRPIAGGATAKVFLEKLKEIKSGL